MTAVEPTLIVPRRRSACDYRSLIATVAAETDERPRVEVGVARWTPDNDTTLVLEFPDIHFWCAPADTIVGISSTGRALRIHANNRILRDDTQRLRAIGALVSSWYSVLRRTIDLTWRSYDFFQVGTMLMSVTSGSHVQQINTVITRVRWDFQRVTTQITSEFAELDFAAMFGGRARVR